MKSKKVLVFGITDNPGGVESVVMNYYRNFDHTRIQLDFLCNTKEVAYEDEILRLGGKIFRVTARSKNPRKYNFELKSFFREHAQDYDAIWVNLNSLANIDYLILAKKYGIKKRIIHCHNSENMDSWLRGILHKINRLRLKRYATDFWSCSAEASSWFYGTKIINGKNYMVVNNAIDPMNFKYDDDISRKVRREMGAEQKIVIGNIGRLHFQKNQTFLLEIFDALQEKAPESELWLVGEGEDAEKLKRKAKNLKIDKKVRFLGVRNDVPDLLCAMDCFVLPSLFEGLSVALLEAQAAGLPCVASRDVIPSEVEVLPELCTRKSLSDSAKEWAGQIVVLASAKRSREVNMDFFSRRGYNIHVEAKKMEKLF